MTDAELKALNERVAVEVMGEAKRKRPALVGYPPREMWWKVDGELMEHAPDYAGSIEEAWRVAEKFIEVGCAAWVEGDGHTGYAAGVTSGAGRFEANGDSPAHALCLAALKATAKHSPARSPQSAVEDSR